MLAKVILPLIDTILMKLDVETSGFAGFSLPATCCRFDHTEQLLFAGSQDKTARLWSLKNYKLLNTFTGHVDYINTCHSLFASQKGITGSSDKSMKEWDFNTLKQIRSVRLFNSSLV